MASSLLKDLTKAGFSALRLQPGATVPPEGWLVRGVFTQVQEGNHLQRALIGFGEGATDVQVVTKVDDLSQGRKKMSSSFCMRTRTRTSPGAGVCSKTGKPIDASRRLGGLKRHLLSALLGLA